MLRTTIREVLLRSTVFMAEMAHFSQNLMTSGALVLRGVQQTVEIDRTVLPAYKRRLSRPNTKQELRAKQKRRRQRRRELDRRIPMKAKLKYKEAKAVKRLEEQARHISKKLETTTKYANDNKRKALHFWKLWRQEQAAQNKTSR